MQIISWNIQCGRGVDGKVDLGRISAVIKEMGDADVICLQEVSRYNPDLDGGLGHDQLDELATHFKGYNTVFGAAIDRIHAKTNRRWQFGNAVLTKLPIRQIFCHQLPQPEADKVIKHMPRQATEIVIEHADLPLRVMTTHLEFHSMKQRVAQMIRLRELFFDIVSNQEYQFDTAEDDPYFATPRPAASILCGDFNAIPNDEDYQALITPLANNADQFHDAWRLLHSGKAHSPTCGIFDHIQWPQGPHCRDYFFVSREIATKVEKIEVQEQTDASDHQPVALTIDFGPAKT